MSFYNMLFGMNAQSDLLLAVIGLRQNDIERFRDVSHDNGETIAVYTRTGGGNREDYPNIAMRKLPAWHGSVDDDYDNTYCTDTFVVPEQWQEDVRNLGDILSNGMRKEFAQHLAKTLLRPPTEGDKEQVAYDAEARTLARTEHFKANGHTFVPKNDSAMETALKLAEANDGRLRTCWGILPLQIVVKTNHIRWPNAKNESDRLCMDRIAIDTKWEIDEPYWEHCKKRWMTVYPVTMGKIDESVQEHLAKR